ncbi:MAG: mechanosensitive ion channel [Deltaproteobacteria bacterium]|nr:mechanosensitive ion channel [Deltaproteobacteria bacterium]
MNTLLNLEMLNQRMDEVKQWLYHNIFVWENLIELALQVFVLLAARLIGTLIGTWFRNVVKNRFQEKIRNYSYLSRFVNRSIELMPLIFSIFILWLCVQGVNSLGHSTFLMALILNLSVAWVIIQLAASIILDHFWSRVIAALSWSIAALNIIGILDETIAIMERTGFHIGGINLTLLSIMKGLVILVALLKCVGWFSAYLEKRLVGVPEILPSTRLMITKSVNIILVFLVCLVALNSIGINLTALTLFSGAIGVGIGFGLQKVVGNFVSGLILLSDKSIKPGDVVQLADVYGYVNHMGGRYVSVVTRDEKEYLIPNEDLIAQQVINWSYSSKKIRVRVPVGITYKADPHAVIQMIAKAVKGIKRVLTDPPPVCLLKGFGENSVDLELRFWIEDPQNGVANVTSEALLKIWDSLKENHIEIPFPQRDVHLLVDKNLNEIGLANQEKKPS